MKRYLNNDEVRLYLLTAGLPKEHVEYVITNGTKCYVDDDDQLHFILQVKVPDAGKWTGSNGTA